VGGGFGGRGLPGGGFPPGGNRGNFPGTGTAPTVGNAPAGGGFPGRGGGGIGGILGASTPSAELTSALQQDADQYTWAAATIGANQAAGYQLASGESVMAIGGFNGTDPWPTLEVFQQYVADGKIHYFIGGGVGMQASSGSNASQEIASWVAANYPATTVGSTTVYDLTGATGTT